VETYADSGRKFACDTNAEVYATPVLLLRRKRPFIRVAQTQITKWLSSRTNVMHFLYSLQILRWLSHCSRSTSISISKPDEYALFGSVFRFSIILHFFTRQLAGRSWLPRRRKTSLARPGIPCRLMGRVLLLQAKCNQERQEYCGKILPRFGRRYQTESTLEI
jgi:hypothetical protein